MVWRVDDGNVGGNASRDEEPTEQITDSAPYPFGECEGAPHRPRVGQQQDTHSEAIRRRSLKLHASANKGQAELDDLATDLDERRNLTAERRENAADLRAQP